MNILIPCYWLNSDLIEKTRLCVETMLDTANVIPILIDDGSPLKPEFEYRTITLEKNVGYTKAVNEGFKYTEGDIVIVSNNDVEFLDPNWLEELIKPLKKGYGISSIRSSEDGWQTEDRWQEDGKFGSLFAITRDAWDKLGGLDEQFHSYFSDLDLHTRAKKLGIKVVRNHNALYYHKPRSTYSLVDSDLEKMRELFIQKHGAVW